ncbi:MAG TPA: hypothetical protein PLS69_02485 [Terricaulis sp.]|nr:hypothetical protein [Terricaulis sp.]HRP11632.1 hypothetical protein [Terricaulis sp.]
MRLALIAIAAFSLTACGAKEPHPYPDGARAAFARICTADAAVCDCMWNEITRAMPYDEYRAALARFEAEGLMDPRITRARTRCTGR